MRGNWRVAVRWRELEAGRKRKGAEESEHVWRELRPSCKDGEWEFRGAEWKKLQSESRLPYP
ncbi:MAG: hypothetical protein GY820_28150 [Gammaproteobacteria bacterium]|nr:hypothetical protein [Gammaproteobacteria bacterium]